jgi:hypothetical protein
MGGQPQPAMISALTRDITWNGADHGRNTTGANNRARNGDRMDSCCMYHANEDDAQPADRDFKKLPGTANSGRGTVERHGSHESRVHVDGVQKYARIHSEELCRIRPASHEVGSVTTGDQRNSHSCLFGLCVTASKKIILQCLNRLNSRIFNFAVANLSNRAFGHARFESDLRNVRMLYPSKVVKYSSEKLNFFHDETLSAHLWVYVNPLMGYFYWHSPIYG